MNTAISVTSRWYQGRLFRQQRDIPRRHSRRLNPSGQDVLVTQTWVYRGAPDESGSEFPARYTCEFRPVWRTLRSLPDRELFELACCDLRLADDDPLAEAAEAERMRRWFSREYEAFAS